MSKLLSANFMRMIKDKVFWIEMILMAFYGVVLAHNQYDASESLREVFANYIVMIGILCPIFCSLFLGTEYSDGTMRNKLVVGHTRLNIYLSNLIVSIAASLLMSIVFIVSLCAVGIPLVGSAGVTAKELLQILFGSAMVIIVYCALCTLVCMLNQNKASVAVVTIIGFFALLFLSTSIAISLEEEEYYSGYEIIDENGEVSFIDATEEELKNPRYISGTKRKVYEFLKDFLPTGQAMQYANFQMEHLPEMILYSLLITAASTGGGIAAFRKKDIK